MNKLYTFFIFASLVLSTSLFAQTETFTVSGVVTDATTGETLVGANVYFPALYIGAASDVNGEYSITVVAGTHKITCSYVGYEKIEQEVEQEIDATVFFLQGGLLGYEEFLLGRARRQPPGKGVKTRGGCPTCK